MTVDSIAHAVGDVRSIYAIVMALAIAEAFKQSVRELRPVEEKHSVTLKDWLECVYPNRLLLLLVFLLTSVSMFLGNQKYLYAQYVTPLYTDDSRVQVNAFWLNIDASTFIIEAGLLFVMSRSLSAHRWQQFYGTFVVLLGLDLAWILAERGRGEGVPMQWAWFDLSVIIVCCVAIVVDRFFMRYDRGKEVNLWCFIPVSLIVMTTQIVSFFFQQANYLLDL